MAERLAVISRPALCLWVSTLVGACGASHEATSQPAPPALSRAAAPKSSLDRPATDQPSERSASSAATGPASTENLETPTPRSPGKPHAFQEALPDPALSAKLPIMRYANFSSQQCRAELKQRGVATERAGGPASGIATPVRLKGPLRGIRFVTPGRRSIYGKLDCRLAVALDELAAILARHDVSEVQIDNLYRPRAHLAGSRKRSQHAYGLAVDLLSLTLRDGKTLEIERDWQGTIGAPPCGPESELLTESDAAILLRNLVCDVARQGIFHHVLTPNFDRAHKDHLHVDIKRGDRASIVR